jgi:hypothetical protein
MTASSIRDAPFHLRTPPRDVRVTNWGVRDDPWRSLPMMALGAALAVGVGVVSQSVAAGCLAAAATAVALWRTWLPVGYDFNPGGVSQIVFRRRRVIPWLAIANYEFTPRGVLLFPHGEPTRWNAARALFVHWSGKRQEVTEIVEYFLGGRLMLEESSRSQRAAAATITLEQPRQIAGADSQKPK